MAKKIALNYDFLAVFISLFIASCGYNIYQDYQYKALFTKQVDLTWKAQNTAADLVYTRNQLKFCKAETGAADPAPGSTD